MSKLETIDVVVNPKCINYKGATLTAEGFFLPCPWVDRRNSYFKSKGFFKDELNISNINDPVTEVFHSDVWVDFLDRLAYNDKSLPNVCKEHCGINQVTNRKV